MKSIFTFWRTSFGGLLSAVGTIIMNVPDPTTHLIGSCMSAAGVALLGAAAADGTHVSPKG
jgi:hypothetical protein